ncbi:hypothetical protein BST61_g3707 [Cercospora zeina]
MARYIKTTALIAALASGALAAPQGNLAGGLLKTGTGALSGKGSPLGSLGGIVKRQYGYGSDKKPATYGGEKPVYGGHEVYDEHKAYPIESDPEHKPYPVEKQPSYPTLTKHYAPAKPTTVYPEADKPIDHEHPVVVDPVDNDDHEPVEQPDNATAISNQCGVGNAVSCCNTAGEGDLLNLVLGAATLATASAAPPPRTVPSTLVFLASQSTSKQLDCGIIGFRCIATTALRLRGSFELHYRRDFVVVLSRTCAHNHSPHPPTNSTMCDFSQYGGASEELSDLLATLPAPAADAGIEVLKRATNQGREDQSRKEMAILGEKVALLDHSVPARDSQTLAARSYRPKSIPSDVTLPIYIHFHGGGFIFGTLDSEDATCARIALASDVVVFNVNYRHTPEWRYPTAWHDAEDAFEWVIANAKHFAGDPQHIVVGGISAGGQLAAALTLTKKRENAPSYASIKGQVLMIPALANIDSYEHQLKQLRDPLRSSYKENEFAPILPLSRINLMNGLLFPHPPRVEDRRVNVGAASAEEVQGLPPTTFGIAGLDPLRDEALLYAKFLAEHGVATDVHVFKGVPHGFRRFGEKLALSADWDKVMHDGVRWALSHPPANLEMVVNVHEGKR